MGVGVWREEWEKRAAQLCAYTPILSEVHGVPLRAFAGQPVRVMSTAACWLGDAAVGVSVCAFRSCPSR